MEEQALCRYVERAATLVVTDIVAHRGAGPSFRLQEHLWVIPMTWQASGRLVLTGEVQVREVAGPRTQVVLVIDEAGPEAVPDELLDALMDGLARQAR